MADDLGGKDPYTLDADEKEVLKKYQYDNPKFVCFKDTDSRVRTLEERFAECEMEKLVLNVYQQMQERRTAMTKDSKVQTLPIHPKVPSALELRQQRNKITNSFTNVEKQERFIGFGDVLTKEVALTEESRNNLPNALVTLQAFYRDQLELLPRKEFRYISRWISFSQQPDTMIAQLGALEERLETIRASKRYCNEAFNRISTYADILAMQANRQHDPSSAAGKVEDTRSTTMLLQSRVPQELSSGDVRVYLRHQSFLYQTRKRWERFSSKAMFLPMSKRYELFEGCIKYLIGGTPASGGDKADAIPRLPLTDSEVVAQLDDLTSCFKLTGHDKADLLEFMYHVNKRYSAVFESQNAAWQFQPLEPPKGQHPSQKSKSEQASNEEEVVYLRATTWEDLLKLEAKLPEWHNAQDAQLRHAVPKISKFLRAEKKFLSATNCASTMEKWKDRVQTHVDRANVRARMARSTPVSDDEREDFDERENVDDDYDDSDSEEPRKKKTDAKKKVSHQFKATGASQRLLALAQLRYLRIREFRKNILNILNYFASVHRSVALDCAEKVLTHTATGVQSPVPHINLGAERNAEEAAVAPMVESGLQMSIPPIDKALQRLLNMYDSTIVTGTVEGTTAPQKPAKEEGAAAATQPKPVADTPQLTVTASQSGDRYTTPSGSSTQRHVYDEEGNRTMYQWALEQLRSLEAHMLLVASYYVARFNDDKYKTLAVDADYSAILEDLYESEMWFQEGKLKVIDGYREAYEHTLDREEQARLAEAMLTLIFQRPHFDLGDRYFTPSYTNEVIKLELLYTLQREIVSTQMQAERAVRMAANPHGPRAKPTGLLEQVQPDGQIGGPDPLSTDTKLFFSLYPGTSVISIMDIFTSLGVLADLPMLVNNAVESLVSDLSIDQPSGRQFLEREIIQELLVQWRLLGEEDRVIRQLQGQKLTTPSNDELFDSHSAFNDIDALDRAVHDVSADTDASSRGQRVTKKRDLPGSRGVAETNAELPEPSPEFLGFVTAMECYSVRPPLMRALFETELLYNIHRAQAKRMGVSVRKMQLEPIDFETRKTFNEIDEFDNMREAAEEAGDALSVKCELLTNLAIAEFEQSMARFDLGSAEGLKKLLAHSYSDFRRALTAQTAQKNMLIAITLCNQVPLDLHYDTVLSQLWQKAIKEKPTSDPAIVRCRLPEWPGHAAVVHTSSHESKDDGGARVTLNLSDIDKSTLQKLYISVNQVKSVHRKCILLEMNSRTADVLNLKKPELLRRKMKELKCELVHEYCLNVMLSTYQYAAKYQACTYAIFLRNVIQRNPELRFFTPGNRNDVIRPQPRTGGTAQGEARRLPTCMITRNAKLDDARYIPHVIQILTMEFEGKDKLQQAGAATAAAASGQKDSLTHHEHIHFHGQSHIRTNHVLLMLSKILYHWVGIIQLIRSQALLRLPPHGALRNPQAVFEIWKAELIAINSELENIRDPNAPDHDGINDVAAVEEFLHNRHCSLYLRLNCGLRALRHQLLRQRLHTAAQHVSSELQAIERVVGCMCARPSRLLWPNVYVTHQASFLRTGDTLARLKASVYYEHVCRIKTMRIGSDFESTISECENTPAGALSLSPNEAFFFEEVERNHFAFMGERLTIPYENLLRKPLLLANTQEERDSFVRECARLDNVQTEANEDIYETIMRNAAENGANTLIGSKLLEYSPIMFELLVLTLQRDRLRDLYYYILRRMNTLGRATLLLSALHSTHPNTKTEHAVLTEQQLDDLYTRNVVHKSRILHDRETATAEAEGKGRLRGGRRTRGFEKEFLRMQVYVLETEINKLLITQALMDLKAVKNELEIVSAPMNTDVEGVLTQKEGIFTDFVNILLSRAVLVRDEQRAASYHIPEASLQLAIDTVGKRVKEWGVESFTNIINTAQHIVTNFQSNIASFDQKFKYLQYMREIDNKAIDRRVESRVADEQFDLLFCNASLEKENAALRHKLSVIHDTVRAEVRTEYEEQIADLKQQLMLSQGQFKSYQKKLYRDMQVSLEEIKRGAMLSVGKMDNAPLHMKRQALKIAISDDELNTLKEQNAELKQAITKIKLWYEMKLLRMKAAFQKQMQEVSDEVEASRTKYWADRQTTEKERDDLRSRLTHTENQLSQCELEVEQLRKDLQLQLTNKKDLVAWKVQHAKVLEELQRKMKKYEKWEQYDIAKLVSEHERSQQMAGTKSGDERRMLDSSFGMRPGSSSLPRRALSASHDELTALKEKLNRERMLKEKAFSKIDELRQGGDPATNEALVWQRKYFEAASELQRCIKELEVARTAMVAAGIEPPITPEASTPSLLRPFHSASPATPVLPRASTASGQQPRTALPPPPPSRLRSSPSSRIAKLFVGASRKP